MTIKDFEIKRIQFEKIIKAPIIDRKELELFFGSILDFDDEKYDRFFSVFKKEMEGLPEGKEMINLMMVARFERKNQWEMIKREESIRREGTGRIFQVLFLIAMIPISMRLWDTHPVLGLLGLMSLCVLVKIWILDN